MRQDAQELIASISEALGPLRQDRGGDAGGVPDFWESRPGTEDAVRFIETLSALGGHGHIVRGRGEVRGALREIFAQERVRTAVRWRDGYLDDLIGSDEATERDFGCRIEAVGDELGRQERIGRIAAADAGIVLADFAIASTGTLVHRSGGDRLKSVSLLPPVLIALVHRSQVVDILSGALREIRAWLSTPRENQGVQMISGPSRSSDIENDLMIGVHGPGRVHALVIEEEPRDARGAKG